MEYQKLKVKRFAHKSFKHSQDGRYWKKFDAVFAKMEKGFMTADASFCVPHNRFDSDGAAKAQNAEVLATATSLRVDLWKLR